MIDPTRTRMRAAVVLLSAGALLLTGCGASVTSDTTGNSAGGEDNITVENCEREIVLNGPPEAVVGMHPAQTELLLRLGLADRLVGQAQSTAQALPEDVASLADDVPAIGGAMPPSREDLLSVEPDFVYSPTTYEFTAEQGFASIEQLEQAGAAVYVAAGGCKDRRMDGEVTDLFLDLENLGTIFGVEDAAADLIADSEADLEVVSDAVSDVEKLRVAQVYVEGGTLQGIGAGIEYDILRSAGADTIFTPEQPAFAGFFAATVSPESLAAEEPDALVFSVYDEAHEAATRDYLTSTFPDMPAVRDDRLIAVSSADMFPGTLGNIEVVRQIAEALYPDAF